MRTERCRGNQRLRPIDAGRIRSLSCDADHIEHFLRALAAGTEIRAIAWRGEQMPMMLYTPFGVCGFISAFRSPDFAADTLRIALERLTNPARDQSEESLSGRIQEIAWWKVDPPVLQPRIQLERRSRSAVPVTL